MRNFSLAVMVILLASVVMDGYGQQKLEPEACTLLDTQAEMNRCYAKEAKEADVALNATYQQLVSRLKGNKVALAKLIASERAWIAFRNADIEAMWPTGSNEDPNATYGSVHPMCVSIALAGMSYQRRRDLEERMVRQEGDLCSDAIAGCSPKPVSRSSEGSAGSR